ncbi:MAG TPA: SMC family ATPase [Ktedonobacterales bacterium]
MLITRVELQNIKSFRHAAVTLRRGTTAVRGHNGAGKSTLVEAIGWALFDALPYSQSQFVREGERSGQVTVTFLSADDDREYQVVRRAGSAPAWYVYDPELDHRPAEQKADVLDFLRRHLRVDGEIALDALFTDALGVPQGTLTADFLLTAAHRKKKFDALLQVEDFSRAAEKLRDTRSYLHDSIHAQDTEIARLERETESLDAWRADMTAKRERERELGIHLAETQRQHDAAAAQRDALLQREREVKRLESVTELAHVAWESAERAAGALRAQVAEAEEAERVCAASRADHEIYQRAEGTLADARGRATTRDHRLRQRADLHNAFVKISRDVEHTRGRLEQALAAERRAAELAPLVKQQQALAQRRESLTRDAEKLSDAQAQGAARAREAEGLAAEIARTEQQIAAIERGRGEAGLLAERRLRVDELRDAQATRAERGQRLKTIAAELPTVTEKRAKAARQAEASTNNVTKLVAHQSVAERLPELEAEHQRLTAESERLRATIEQHRESRAQSVGGQCPFLREPCENIRRRGLASLETYFDRLIERDEAALAALHDQTEALRPDLEHAREVAKWYARLDEYQERLQRDHQVVADHDERLTALVAERDQLAASLAALGGPDELDAARTLLAHSDEADRRLRELGPLQMALDAARQRMAAVQEEQQRSQKLIERLAEAPAALRETEEALTALGDPLRDAAREEGLARERPGLQDELTRHEAACAEATRRLELADELLAPFAGLDAEIAALEAALGAASQGHQRYLRHIQEAQRLPERRAALQAAEEQARAAAQTHVAAAAASQRAAAAFDPDALSQVAERTSALHAELSRATQELRSLQEQIVEREAAIVRAQAFLAELAAARDERGTLHELLQMLEQFRATIKEAGPYVMRALLRQISLEANRIFGEIMGDRSAQLSWQDDYEIVLQRGGQERRFAQLSGGEQMSAALAVRLALLRNLSRLDIAFFDEPTQNMDGERRGNLAEQLRRVHGFDQLVVISHDDTFEQGLDSVIHIEKRGGETVLVEEDALVEA